MSKRTLFLYNIYVSTLEFVAFTGVLRIDGKFYFESATQENFVETVIPVGFIAQIFAKILILNAKKKSSFNISTKINRNKSANLQ